MPGYVVKKKRLETRINKSIGLEKRFEGMNKWSAFLAASEREWGEV